MIGVIPKNYVADLFDIVFILLESFIGVFRLDYFLFSILLLVQSLYSLKNLSFFCNFSGLIIVTEHDSHQ